MLGQRVLDELDGWCTTNVVSTNRISHHHHQQIAIHSGKERDLMRVKNDKSEVREARSGIMEL